MFKRCGLVLTGVGLKDKRKSCAATKGRWGWWWAMAGAGRKEPDSKCGEDGGQEGPRAGPRMCVCVCVLVAQSCWTLCDPMNCSPPGSSVCGIPQARNWSGLPCPFPGDLPDPRTAPGSPELQTDSFLFEPPRKPRAKIKGSI